MKNSFFLFVALFFCASPLFAQQVGSIEKRDRLKARNLEMEFYFKLLTPEIEKYKNHDVQSLVNYIDQQYLYRIKSFVGYGPIQATGIELMYTPNVVVVIVFENTFSTEERNEKGYISRMSDETMHPIALKQKIKSVEVKIWDYSPEDFPDMAEPK